MYRQMKPFDPRPLPLDGLDLGSFLRLAGEANRTLARYDGLLAGLINPQVLLSPLTTKEAERSSRIEGTQAELGDVYQYEAGVQLGESLAYDSQEIINYRTTLSVAHDSLKGRPLSLSLIKGMHAILLESVRGQDKSPGEFRREQSWIGARGCTIDEATYVPPGPLRVLDHLENWEAYLTHDEVDPIIQAAIVHAQFEIIHPFIDGNGRLGRLMVPLFLFKSGVLAHPMFYLSAYLEANRDEYYARLDAISKNDDWDGWIRFFMQAVVEQARNNSDKVRAINDLYEQMKERIQAATHSQYTITLLDSIFSRPVFRSTALLETTGIQRSTLMALLRHLKESNIIRTLFEGSGRTPAVLVFPDIINIVEERTVF